MKLEKCDDCGKMVPADQFHIADVQCIECAKAQELDAIRGDEGYFTIPHDGEAS